eukprot:gene9553-9629_t
MAHSLFDLSGRIALVTGSSQGIGLGIARGLAQAGAKVVLNGRNVEKLADAQLNLQKEAFYDWVCARTPAGRWADIDELAGAAIFLSSAASNYVNGQILMVDGGMTAAV